MDISSVGSTTSFLSQLQNMQRQMNMLSAAAGGSDGVRIPFNAPQAAASDTVELSQAPAASEKVGEFADVLRDAFETVNNLQNEASNMQTRFDAGDRQVSLSDVMLATQKSGISFEAAVQVRNKLIEAYKTISQMQI